MGLFPCALVTPLLAVNLRVLQFVKTLFVWQTPNVTAWCRVVEVFLAGHGYTFALGLQLVLRKNTSYPQTTFVPAVRFVLVGMIGKRHDPPISCDDPPNPITLFFVLTEVVDEMESLAEQCRTQGHHGRVVTPDSIEDVVEKGMHVPVSVLDGCGQSFIAADERREKASTQFFADTGLMALLCHHDRVLWLVNLTFQFGVSISSMHMVINGLVKSYTTLESVKALACWMVKAVKLGSGMWTVDCKLVDVMWGNCVLNGWLRSSIRQGLHQYHQQLFVLDMQVRHLNTKSLAGFALWLSCQWSSCQARKRDADRGLQACGCDEGELRAQWVAQVKHQTRPSPRQSKNKVDKEIGMILELEQLVKARAAIISALELRFMANRITDFASFELDIADARAQYDKLSDMLLRHHAALGVSATARLRQLRHSKYLQVCVNALAVKTWIHDCLHGRKFELERMENAYRQSAGEQRLRVHTEAAVKCHEPTLLWLISTYNSLCETLAALIRRHQAVHGAVAPCPIACEGLYDLDVDDDIWQDIGLTDDSVNPPPWLADENVHMGICHLLARDRCQEEEGRLARERCNLQEWIGAEWDGVCAALASHAESGDVGM
ncbi:hypothetical protein BDN67DRAFT_985349, partial [Paxillus ammoniavirescens]